MAWAKEKPHENVKKMSLNLYKYYIPIPVSNLAGDDEFDTALGYKVLCSFSHLRLC